MAGLFRVTTSRQHELIMRNPGLCDELRIRDILDDVVVMTSGAFVAGYELGGLHSHYHTDEMRNRAKESLEAVLRSMPERSRRLHLRCEICEDSGYRRHDPPICRLQPELKRNSCFDRHGALRTLVRKRSSGRIPRLSAVCHLPLGSRHPPIRTWPRMGARIAPHVPFVREQMHPAHAPRAWPLISGIHITSCGN